MTTTSTTPHIYRSKDPAPVIPTEMSIWQVFLEYNPDLVPDNKDDGQETEVPLAYVKLKPHIAKHGIPQTLQHIRAFMDGRGSSYEKPRGGVHHLEAIPKNPTGKVLRRLLPARIELDAKYAQLKRRKGK
ncbi:hypothetical protein MPDQ_006196 [Monascus purpureus]|uniref:AMP-binding enzyme C-terminal domain-containing protein n=1 Tax=Monascus purpureus TaxID=5098 RepID=A0A507QZ39_MONPU|nr:hypothetical protein MPDQ_006196 [Monascus purpureus]